MVDNYLDDLSNEHTRVEITGYNSDNILEKIVASGDSEYEDIAVTPTTKTISGNIVIKKEKYKDLILKNQYVQKKEFLEQFMLALHFGKRNQ